MWPQHCIERAWDWIAQTEATYISALGRSLTVDGLQVNVPKTRRTYCKGKECKKHTNHKVTQYKAGKVRNADSEEQRVATLISPAGLPIRPG